MKNHNRESSKQRDKLISRSAIIVSIKRCIGTAWYHYNNGTGASSENVLGVLRGYSNVSRIYAPDEGELLLTQIVEEERRLHSEDNAN